jgi:NAD(P)-dependent dehydrogenase (short-subunit alcohol dehydrogenase family)
LEAAPTSRVVLTSSAANYNTYDYGVAADLETLNGVPHSLGMKCYGQSKLAQILFAQELTRQLGPDSTVYVNNFHPGAAASEIWEKNPGIPDFLQPLINALKEGFMWTCADGALTGLYLGVRAQHDNIRGRY